MRTDTVLHVLIRHSPPLAFVEGQERPIGFLPDLLPKLLELANITHKIEYEEVDQSVGGGLLHPNGTWSGVMGRLVNKTIDLAAFPLTLTAERASCIDYTPPFLTEGYGILKGKMESGSDFRTFLDPFSSNTWLALLGAVLLIGVLMFLLDRSTGMVRQHVYDKLELQSNVARSSCHRFVFEGLVSFVGFGREPMTMSWSTRILWLTWLVFGVVFMSAYTANLTASLTLDQFRGGVETLQELLMTEGKFGVKAEGSVAAFFEKSQSSTALSMKGRTKPYTSKDMANAVDDIRHGELMALISDYYNVVYLSKSNPCELGVAKETFGPYQLVLGLPKDSPFSAPLTKAMLEVEESGFLGDLKRKYLSQSPNCPADDRSLTFMKVSSIFILLAIGCAFAVFYAIGECIYLCCCFQRIGGCTLRPHTPKQQSNPDFYLPSFHGSSWTTPPPPPPTTTAAATPTTTPQQQQQYQHQQYQQQNQYQHQQQLQQLCLVVPGDPSTMYPCLQPSQQLQMAMANYPSFGPLQPPPTPSPADVTAAASGFIGQGMSDVGAAASAHSAHYIFANGGYLQFN